MALKECVLCLLGRNSPGVTKKTLPSPFKNHALKKKHDGMWPANAASPAERFMRSWFWFLCFYSASWGGLGFVPCPRR